MTNIYMIRIPDVTDDLQIYLIAFNVWYILQIK